MRTNTGKPPRDLLGKRVRGYLANGHAFGLEAVTSTSPAGWAVDGKQGCRWSLTDSPFDIARYEEAK